MTISVPSQPKRLSGLKNFTLVGLAQLLNDLAVKTVFQDYNYSVDDHMVNHE